MNKEPHPFWKSDIAAGLGFGLMMSTLYIGISLGLAMYELITGHQ